MASVGRPRLLSEKAEAELLRFIVQARGDGAVIDRDSMAMLGQEVCSLSFPFASLISLS